METKWSELRLWTGGECPVGPDEKVLLLFEDMETRFGFARNYAWSHAGDTYDIIAYRVEVKPKPLIERWVNVYTDSVGKEQVSNLLYFTKSAAQAAVGAGMDARQVLLREVRE